MSEVVANEWLHFRRVLLQRQQKSDEVRIKLEMETKVTCNQNQRCCV